MIEQEAPHLTYSRALSRNIRRGDPIDRTSVWSQSAVGGADFGQQVSALLHNRLQLDTLAPSCMIGWAQLNNAD